ncbi:sigma-70 family RNA polymerase sigma factor [Janthinobacterium psychrotolerans]|uniref:RNA polymerase sigma-70 factor, ECF subfamily n=1 Tax=Janthinobacterium psychrotolerans TaxID=1747903 RepID=A0A1A7C7F6_9BURK|nr:sigma-70 family RNA polymerase sigma factor [Janthinobacterium psychrotolerans]OBV40954.1 RNA polymerase sigma-70 factor, ECF subfamily [Janthinobacterium psychrotolerans]
MPASKPYTDAEVQHGDAVGKLYGEHHGWLLSWLRLKLGSSHLAADLAHDTFLRVLAMRSGLTLLQPRAYLRTIAHGLAVNRWRRLDIERACLDALAAMPPALAPSPEERLLVLETLHRLDTMLARLPHKARRAFLMHQLDGSSYAEIAVELGVSERMVRKYMAQAMLQCLCLQQED